MNHDYSKANKRTDRTVIDEDVSVWDVITTSHLFVIKYLYFIDGFLSICALMSKKTAISNI